MASHGVMSPIQEEPESKPRFASHRKCEASSAPKMASSKLPIKLNSSAILRERLQRNRLVQREQQRLECLMEGTGEPSSFLHWQREMREKDLQEEVLRTEARRIEERISSDRQALARTQLMEHKQKAAKLQKEEVARQMRIYAQKRMQEGKEMRDLVRQAERNSASAKQKLLELKQNIVREVSEQSQALLRQALEEAQAELSRKFEIIREIHAIESVPHIREKFFDDTEVKSHGVMEEMSLVELRERLVVLKAAKEKELQERRTRIQEGKESRKKLLADCMEAIGHHRRALAKVAASRVQVKTVTRMDLLRAAAKDERIVALKEEAEKTKQERQRVEKSKDKIKIKTKTKPKIKRVKTPRQVTTKKSVEMKSWSQLEQNLELQVHRE